MGGKISRLVPSSLAGFRPFYGWWIVLAATVLAVGEGVWYYGFTAFFDPIRQTFGWSSTITSVAFMLREAELGLVAPLIGLLADRLHPRGVVLGGVALTGLGLVLMAGVASLWQFYLAFVLLALGSIASGKMVAYIVISRWFVRRRARVIGVITAGSAVSGLALPVLVWGVTSFGWRPVLVGMGVAAWVVLGPFSLLMRRRPQDMALLPDGAPLGTARGPAYLARAVDLAFGQALRTRAFWMLGLAYGMWAFMHASLTVHIIPALSRMGVPLDMAGLAAGALPMVSIIGRLGMGTAADFVSKRLILGFSFVLMALGLLSLTGVGIYRAPVLLVPAVLLYSVGFGGVLSVFTALQADYFGTRSLGAIQGSVYALSTVGGATGPVLAGWVVDTTGTYQAAFVTFALVAALGTLVVGLARPPASG